MHSYPSVCVFVFFVLCSLATRMSFNIS